MRASVLLVALAVSGMGAAATLGQQAPAVEAAAAAPGPYEGHRAVRVTAGTPRELMTVLALTDDVLTCQGAGVGTFDVRFTAEQYEAFQGTGIAHEILIENLQAHLDSWYAQNEVVRQQARSGWYEAFRNLAEIEARLEELALAHPGLATLSVIGTSIEGRPIRMLRITAPGAAHQRPALVINGTQHSREALSPMVTMYFAEHLLTQYALDPQVQAMVNGIDFFIIPVVNPDGYAFCWAGNWMWRLNRRPSPCGVDLNRNWGHQWGQNGSSATCAETYRGLGAFSEPETRAIGSIIDMLGQQGRLRAHLDVHSASQLLLSPWGYTTQPPPALPQFNHLGLTMRNAIATHRGILYQYGPGSLLLYIVSGAARDYSYGTYNAMSWTVELPPQSVNFYPPPSEIIPASAEMALGIGALAEFYLNAEMGACALTGSCLVTSESWCASMGGTFQGIGATCPPVLRPRILTTTPSTNGTNTSGAGVFLDLSAPTRTLDVYQLDYYASLSQGSTVVIDVYTYPGSYIGHDTNPTGWVLHERITSTSNGSSNLRPLQLSTPIHIPRGETVGVYLIAEAGGMRYRFTSTGTHPLLWSDDHLTLFSNLVRTAPWGGLATPTGASFAGAVHYHLRPRGHGCYPNCDNSTIVPTLNVEDFACFINEFAAAMMLTHEEQVHHYANCDRSTVAPALNVEDFACFINTFAAGCP
jgi:hypothetical protein